MHETIGQDGEVVDKTGSPPAVAKQFDLRILRHMVGPHGPNARNQKELTILSVVLDHLVLGRYERAADVIAAGLTAVECAHREGSFANAQHLELIPVNVEGLTSADDKEIVRQEQQWSKADWNSSNANWQASGKGKPEKYNWISKGQGKWEKGKKGEKGKGKGKKGSKGKDE